LILCGDMIEACPQSFCNGGKEISRANVGSNYSWDVSPERWNGLVGVDAERGGRYVINYVINYVIVYVIDYMQGKLKPKIYRGCWLRRRGVLKSMINL